MPTRRLRAELAASDVRWSRYGQFVHRDEPKPDLDKLVRSNGLDKSIFDGELQGRAAEPTVGRDVHRSPAAIPTANLLVVWRQT